MAGTLPSVIGLGSGGMYLEYVLQEGQGQWGKRVRRTSRMVLSENNFTRFIVSVSRTAGLIHLQTAFNKKYLRLQSENENWIAAVADDPEEDTSKWTCTLFRRELRNGQLTLFLQARNRQSPVGLLNNALNIERPVESFEVVNLDQLVLLPRNITFLGDNNHPLRARRNAWLQYLATDQHDPRLHHVVETLPNGDVRIIAMRYELYWRKSPNREWIWCDGNRNNPGTDSVFRPIRLNSTNQEIALMNMLQGRFCQRWPWGVNFDCLTASATIVIPLAVMRVGEAVRERQITDIIYRTNEARVHSKVPISAREQSVENLGNSDANQTVAFSYTETMEQTFSSSHTWKISYTSTMRVSLIPKIITGTVQLRASASGSYNFNETTRTTVTETGSITATVPPRSRVTVTMFLSRGRMDVPYSYKQRDILFDGTTRVTQLHDGLFIGVNTFVARFVIGEPESLDSLAYADDSIRQGSNNPNIVLSPITIVDLGVDNEEEAEPQVPPDSDTEVDDKLVQLRNSKL
ncbi:unnamed protein product [Amaranthus hypochondriacus]